MITATKDPHTLFDTWLKEAEENEINDPNAMNLATVDINGRPSSRTMLLKGHYDDLFVFYTNYESAKGKDILENGFCALCFHWKSTLKQIRIEGKAVSTTNKEADQYFATRNRNSQISAWASRQSLAMDDTSNFEHRLKKFEEKFKDLEEVPRPPHWSGFKVIADKFEFWEQMPYRQHNRIVYTKSDKGWSTAHLYP